MTRDELSQIETTQVCVSVDQLKDRRERTLLYGYNLDRTTVHVYLKDGVIHYYHYDHNDIQIAYCSCTRMHAQSLVPTKRLYPEVCDFEFCTVLASMGVHLPFTTYGTMTREPDGFVGNVKC